MPPTCERQGVSYGNIYSSKKFPIFYIVPNYDYSVDIIVVDSSLRMHIDGSTVTTMHMQSDRDVIVNDTLVEKNRIYRFPSREVPVITPAKKAAKKGQV